MLRWSEISQLGQSASEGSCCASGPCQRWISSCGGWAGTVGALHLQHKPSHHKDGQLLEIPPSLRLTFFKDPLLLLAGVRTHQGGMLITSDLPLLHVGSVDGWSWPSSSLVCVLKSLSGPRKRWRERKLCLSVSFLSRKAFARKQVILLAVCQCCIWLWGHLWLAGEPKSETPPRKQGKGFRFTNQNIMQLARFGANYSPSWGGRKYWSLAPKWPSFAVLFLGHVAKPQSWLCWSYLESRPKAAFYYEDTCSGFCSGKFCKPVQWEDGDLSCKAVTTAILIWLLNSCCF